MFTSLQLSAIRGSSVEFFLIPELRLYGVSINMSADTPSAMQLKGGKKTKENSGGARFKNGPSAVDFVRLTVRLFRSKNAYSTKAADLASFRLWAPFILSKNVFLSCM
jgi:hypothetical protein